jgi:uncharacterized cofD-like protein
MTDPFRIVSIGGGTGLSSLLNGLKSHTHGPEGSQVEITAIVTVTDDGGSSGRLRREFDVLPPGDIRNCMVALSEDEAFLSRLFQYRFSAGRGLKGHSFGNLFLTALTHVTGDFPDAVRKSCEVLNIAGQIFPSTASNVSLEAVLEDGTVVSGETRISRSLQPIRRIRLQPRQVRPIKDTLQAIERADLITLGPGSLFTSVIPNLLVKGIPQAIRRSQAVKACFVNLMSQPGETTSFAASDHLIAIQDHAGEKLLDYAVVSNSRITKAVRRAYGVKNSTPIENDVEAIRALGVEVIEADLLMKGLLKQVAVEMAMRGRLRRMANYKHK